MEGNNINPVVYNDKLEYSLNDELRFWNEIALKYVYWDKKYDKIYSDNESNPEWFKGGLLNTCYNALDIHVKEQSTMDRIALIHETPAKGNVNILTYGELWYQVCTFARALKNLGVVKGDRIVIYMPMVNQSIISMLACARLGAIHCVVFGGFSSQQLSKRIEHCEPKVVISCSFGVEGNKINLYSSLLEKALELSPHKPNHVIIYNRQDIIPESFTPLLVKGSIDWYTLTKDLEPLLEYETVDSTHPLYIIYTSGTTGDPKGVVRETGGHIVSMNYAMRDIYGMKPGDTFFATSDIGWVVGHSLSVYGPLFVGMTSVILEGKPTIPDAGVYWRIIEKHNVSAFFSAPTSIRAIHKEDPNGKFISKYNLSSLKYIWLAGERLDSSTFNYLSKNIKKPIIDNYWQTESGYPIITYPLAQTPIKLNSAGKVVPRYNLVILNSQKQIMGPDQIGEICIKLPLPPGFSNTLYKNHNGYIKSYLDQYPGYFRTGDSGYYDEDGYYYIVNRVDDVINVCGHRLSTGQFEEVIYNHPKVVECVCFGVKDHLKGEVPFGLVVLKPYYKNQVLDIEKELINQIRDVVGPIATFKRILSINRLPKTRSGKILRNILVKIFNKEEYTIPPTIDDIEVLDEIKAVFNSM